MAKVLVSVEIDENAITPELADYAIDAVISNPMTTRYGSMATNRLKEKYGEVLLLAAMRAVGDPLKKELEPLNREIAEIIQKHNDKWAINYAARLLMKSK